MSEPWPARSIYVSRVQDLQQLPGWRAACEALLDASELARVAAKARQGARDSALLAHALKRWVLSRHLQVAPNALRFARVGKGRPVLAGGEPLSFNVSHSNDVVVLAVAYDAVAGVDVEDACRRMSDPLVLSASYFAEAEHKDLLSQAGTDVRHRFFAYWTLKEATIKARGEGIAGNLRRMSFVLPDGPDTRPQMRDGSDFVADLDLWVMDGRYLIASAWVGQPVGEAPVLYRWSPVAGVELIDLPAWAPDKNIIESATPPGI